MQDVRQDRAPGTQLSGVVVVLLDEQVPPGTDETLFEHARRFGLDQLVEVLLAVREPPSERLVTSVPVDDLLEAERARVDGPYPPLRSLTRYWRVDVETAGVAVEEALRLLRDVRGVALAYGELVVSEPSLPTDADLPRQRYLDGAGVGVNARAAWTFAGGDGRDVRLFDIEQAWDFQHPDLAALGLATPLCNTNRTGRNGFVGDHGNGTLGVVAGAADGVGIVGIAYGIASVQVASHFRLKGLQIDDPLAVDDALAAVGMKVAPGDVVLLEVQRDGLPAETQVADFDAIRFVLGVPDPAQLGVVFVESAGNGVNGANGVDLDVPQGSAAANTQWWATRAHDSGAVLVGASGEALVAGGHEWFRESNYGATVHCHAWGEQVYTAAGTGYQPGYGGTSAAAAIIAGVAASVQGMHRVAHGAPMRSADLRALLADPANGTPQHLSSPNPIGPMPDLGKLAAAIGAIPGP